MIQASVMSEIEEFSLTSSGSESTSSYSMVHDVVRDLFEAQHTAMEEIRTKVEKQKEQYIHKSKFDEVCFALKQEKLSHDKTKVSLEKEEEKFHFTKNEIEILKRQIQKEKVAFEDTIKTLRAKVTRETKRSDFLYSKCSEAERKIDQQSDEIALKDNEIASLRQRIRCQKDVHKQTLAEININKMQQDYLAKTLNDTYKT